MHKIAFVCLFLEPRWNFSAAGHFYLPLNCGLFGKLWKSSDTGYIICSEKQQQKFESILSLIHKKKIKVNERLNCMGIQVTINCKCKGNTFKLPFMKVQHFFLVVFYLPFQKVLLQPW